MSRKTSKAKKMSEEASEKERRKSLPPCEEGANILEYLTSIYPSRMDSLRTAFGLLTLTKLGKGDFGTVYFCDKTILKLTTDMTEAEASLLVMRSPVHGINKIFHVAKFPSIKETHLEDVFANTYYAIVQSMVNTEDMSKIDKELLDAFNECLVLTSSDKIPWPITPGWLVKEAYRRRQVLAMNSRAGSVARDVAKILNAAKSIGLILKDMHGLNVGMIDGEMVAFDIGGGTEILCDVPEIPMA